MNENTIIGFLVAFVPLFAVGYLMLNKNRGVFRMFVAMLIIGLGYLGFTGALDDIGLRVTGGSGVLSLDAPAPAGEAPAAPAPAQ